MTIRTIAEAREQVLAGEVTLRELVEEYKAGIERRNEEINAFFNSELGKKIASKQEALAADVAEISEHWSRDLFSEKMSKLVKAGYIPQR